MLITQIILGIDDDTVRERLLRMPNVAKDLSKVIEAVRIAEMTKNNAQIIRNDSKADKQVNAVSKFKKKKQ